MRKRVAGVRFYTPLEKRMFRVVAAVLLIFAIGCESTSMGPTAPSAAALGSGTDTAVRPDGVPPNIEPPRGRPENPGPPPGVPRPQVDEGTLPGLWRGNYTWNCSLGNTGSVDIEFRIDEALDTGFYPGSATYLDGTSSALVGRYSGNINDRATWALSPDGSIIEITVEGSSGNFVFNRFIGLMDGSHIEGTTLNGDSGPDGCSAASGPSGTFSVDKV